jgi:hypothetical protein
VASGSAELNPIEFSSSWHFVTIAGTRSPGAISVDGIRGFERPTEWDKKKGKGTQGATLSLVQYPPAEGSIEFQLWLPVHFDQWRQFRPLLRYNTAKKAGDAFELYHPSLADLGISAVVTSKLSPITHKGRGLYVVTVDMIEYFKPPAKSIVSTPSKANTQNTTSKTATPGAPADPVADAQQAEIARLMKEAANTPVG